MIGITIEEHIRMMGGNIMNNKIGKRIDYQKRSSSDIVLIREKSSLPHSKLNMIKKKDVVLIKRAEAGE